MYFTFNIELEWLTNTYNLKECEKWLSAAAKAQAEVSKYKRYNYCKSLIGFIRLED